MFRLVQYLEHVVNSIKCLKRSLCVFSVLVLCTFSLWAQEIPDNNTDEDGDGFLGTTRGYQLRAGYPRGLIDGDGLDAVFERALGANAREPYQSIYQKIRNREIEARSNPSLTPHLMNLAVLARAENDNQFEQDYLTRLRAVLAVESAPELATFASMDLMWDVIPTDLKLRTIALCSRDNAFYYNSHINETEQDFGYHATPGRSRALYFAVMFAFDPIWQEAEVVNNPDTYRFDAPLYIATIGEELQPGGQFFAIENRVGGAANLGDALPGDLGGMYDNFGYDTWDESFSIFLSSIWAHATGVAMPDMARDRHRGRFYQQFQVPTLGRMARVWFTRTDSYGPLDIGRSLTATRYNDPHMQWWANLWLAELLSTNQDYRLRSLWYELFFYDDSLQETQPESNPTSRYFGGPGLVSMRSDWSDDATFGVFQAGDGISRRYEDANAFIIHRKGTVMPHAGGRLQSQTDNLRHHWYTIRSVSKNTMRIMDPNEAFDINGDGTVGDYGSGTPLLPSDNLGGQLFETRIAAFDREYPIFGGGNGYRLCGNFDLGICDVANILKYQFEDGLFTYTVGDGRPAYTAKVEQFDREFLFLPPSSFVVFDRVRARDASFRKIWMLHTVDQPLSPEQAPVDSDHGKTEYNDLRYLTFGNPDNQTHLFPLLPEQNAVVVRGGDTLLCDNRPLNASTPIESDALVASDIPRFVELFALGSDTVGSVTLEGETSEGENRTEVINFNGNKHNYVYGSPTTVNSTSLVDNTRNWATDQWAGVELRTRGGGNETVVITGNNATTYFLDRPIQTGGVWGYALERPVANSYQYWKRITRITTSDMDVDRFIVSIPHYFDTEGVDGTVYSFTPHSDGRNDNFKWDPSVGRWNLAIEAPTGNQTDHFLNVIHLADPNQAVAAPQLIEVTGGFGAMVDDNRVAVFSTSGNAPTLEYRGVDNAERVHVITGLTADTEFFLQVNGQNQRMITSSDQGVAFYTLTLRAGDTVALTRQNISSQLRAMMADWPQTPLLEIVAFINQ